MTSASAMGLMCRPPVCRVEIVDPGFALTVALQPWRDANGVIHEERWSRDVYLPDQAAWDRVDASFPKPGSTVEIVVDGREQRQGWNGDLFAQFGIRQVDDAGLSALASPKPATIEDPFFGTLKWTRERGTYDGHRTVGEDTYVVLIADGGNRPPNLALAQRLIESVEKNTSRIRTETAGRLIDVYNKSWRTGSQRDTAWLAERLHLTGARPAPDRDEVVLYFSDGGAFGGHEIEAHAAAGKVESASIAG